MNKYKLAGTLTALALLLASVILKFGFSGESAAKAALPLLCLGAWALTVFDTLAYRHSNDNAIQKRIELTRLIALYIISGLISIGTLIFIFSS